MDGDSVFFVTGRGDGGLARSTTVELGLDISLCEAKVGRAVVDDARDRFAMRLASAARAKRVSFCFSFSVYSLEG